MLSTLHDVITGLYPGRWWLLDETNQECPKNPRERLFFWSLELAWEGKLLGQKLLPFLVIFLVDCYGTQALALYWDFWGNWNSDFKESHQVWRRKQTKLSRFAGPLMKTIASRHHFLVLVWDFCAIYRGNKTDLASNASCTPILLFPAFYKVLYMSCHKNNNSVNLFTPNKYSRNEFN